MDAARSNGLPRHAMIAAAAYPKFLAKDFAARDLSAEACLRLQ